MLSVPHLCGIYVITCIPTGKLYVGSSQNITRRFTKHRSLLRLNKHPNRHLQNAWNKYGHEAFNFSVLETTDSDELINREQYWVDRFRPFGRKGFNINPHVDKPAMLGKRLSVEVRQKMSASLMGHPTSDETRAKISAALKGKTKGRKHDPEFVERRVAHSRKQWIVTSPDGQEFLVLGLAQICREHGLNLQSMYRLSCGRHLSLHGWRCRPAKE